MTTRPARSNANPGRRALGSKVNVRFFREVVAELTQKVTWPTRDEIVNLTTIVLIVSAAVGLFLGTIDYVFTQLINVLLLR